MTLTVRSILMYPRLLSSYMRCNPIPDSVIDYDIVMTTLASWCVLSFLANLWVTAGKSPIPAFRSTIRDLPSHDGQ